MPSSLFRLSLTVSATFALAFFLWYSNSWTRAAQVPYIVTVNFAIMGWAWFIFDLQKPSLNYRWLDSLPFERNGQIYKWARLSWFQSIQRLIGWNKLLGVPRLQVNVESINEMEYGTRFGEVTHWLCLALRQP